MIQLCAEIQNLLRGHRSTFLVRENLVAHTLAHVTLLLQRYHPSLRLVYTAPYEVYQATDFTFSHIGHTVHITVKHPLTVLYAELTLYHMLCFPTPLPDGSQHTTYHVVASV